MARKLERMAVFRSSTNLSVRPARNEDAEAMGIAQVQSWQCVFAPILGKELVAALSADQFAQTWAKTIATYGDSSDHHLFVARDEKKVVGFITMRPSPDPDAENSEHEISSLIVAPDETRRGHGSRLLAAAADIARAGEVPALTTWIVDGDDAREAFFSGAGFAADGAYRTWDVGSDSSVSERRWSASVT